MPQKQDRDTRVSETTTTISADTVLKIAKEIAVKFIEVGRLTPTTFDETFKAIHRTINETVSTNHE